MADNRNYILAIVLSILVLVGWQYFVGMPQMERQREAQRQQQLQQQATGQAPGTATPAPGAPPAPGQPAAAPGAAAPAAPGAPAPGQTMTREAAIAATPRVAIATPRLTGSINLVGGRVDDLVLATYRETIQRNSPNVVLFAPAGSPIDAVHHKHPFYAEFGHVAGAGQTLAVPNAQTVWTQQGTGTLTPATPVVLTWDNGQGQTFRRTFEIDAEYLITVKDAVVNSGAAPVTLHHFGLISRHGLPQTSGYYILHEGLIGVFGDKGLQEVGYSAIETAKTQSFRARGAWLGITDKYWAAALIPDQGIETDASFKFFQSGTAKSFQTDFLAPAVTVAPGATTETTTRLFAGAKEVRLVDGYADRLKIDRFDRLIDWGWFYFITKPLFVVMDWIFIQTGNFGIAILLVTLLIKGLFFPLANKSYASITMMKKVQPEMMEIRDRYAEDKMKQQQELMALYKREKINPLAGCWPIMIQIPVFFALYKVLFITIEMRHAPFFGWIQDLSAPDPTSIFNLFGLLPFSVPAFLLIGVWPIIMGITMWIQMQMNPAPTDPIQAAFFKWMPILFTFMLASFPAGLVIYWAWNNLLSVLQQGLIMRKYGVKIELWDNMRSMFGGGPAKPAA
ncbi:membrane protein insertase YidC [Phreatobacter oligotrophus]|uniref:membrane protein insertase YidC n=1 Tax=Phreatobacter oligotrophus TaxID=1122261 RepID=UPI002353E164|nr:membrane protein insertase YidC [Phreatobacter oligotrophus]MBX9993087.1 membrane protein insertase YidC [Phreatobacter oligotrophus]